MTKGHTIKSLRDGFAKKQFSAEEIFKEYIDKIKNEDKYNAYLTIFNSRETKNWKLETGNPLSGIPIAVKDNILINGTKCTAGSKILENYISAYDATAIKKLREAGVLFLGKTNMDEFAMGTTTENSAFGPVKNPWDTKRIPGGSSGGSAAAVAADLAVFALGSDTGGSVRQPASMCGVVGLKPTYGRVSRHGLIAMASSFDQIGILAKNISDATEGIQAISGYDIFDSTTVKLPVPDFTKKLEEPARELRIGMPREFFRKGLSKEVEEKIKSAIKKLEELGCKIEEISLPNFEYALAAYYVLVPSEISSNLARFDGIRYGHSSNHAKTLLDTYLESREEGFGPEPKRRIMLGTYALSAGYYDAYYSKAQKVRTLIKKDFDEAFKKVDLIAGPTAPSTAFKLGEKISDPLALYLEDVYTVPANLAGLPAISLPCGLGDESKLPVGFHLMGRPFEEAAILNAAYQLEKMLE